MSEPFATPLVGQTLGNKFFVRRELGRGGMGAVYEVEHVVTKRVGALKLLHAQRASVREVVARFVREASAAAHIENPHIVATYDAGELPSGEPYLFMELLTGSPISALIDARGRLSFELARELVAQAAEALAAAHRAGIVHRDVKPENLFSCEGPRPFVKVLDFGISKFAPELTEREQLTLDGAPMGSPYYMSPEQVVGQRDLDFRTDVYALGVVLYECLTGEVPFLAETLSELGVKIFEGRYTRPSELQPALPAGLDEFLAKAMALEPGARHESMAEFRSELLAFAAPPAALAAPGSTLVIAQPAIQGASPRRRRSGLAVSASIAVALLAVAAGFRALRAPSLAAPSALGVASVPSPPSLPLAPSAVASSRLQRGAEAAQGERSPPKVLAPATASASSAPHPARPASATRARTAPSSRAGQDGLVEANPFH